MDEGMILPPGVCVTPRRSTCTSVVLTERELGFLFRTLAVMLQITYILRSCVFGYGTGSWLVASLTLMRLC